MFSYYIILKNGEKSREIQINADSDGLEDADADG